MKDNLKNFREASDLILENIYVTDELKRKTLEKCTQRKVSIMRPKLTAAFSAALIVSFGIFIYHFNKPAVTDNYAANTISQEHEDYLDKEDKIQEAAKTTSNSDSEQSATVVSNSKDDTEDIMPVPQKNVDIAMKESNNVPQNKSIDVASNENIEKNSQDKNMAEVNESTEIDYQSKSNDVDVVNEEIKTDTQIKDIYVVNENIKIDSQIKNDTSKISDNTQKNSIDTSNSISDKNNGKINPADQVRTTLALAPEKLTIKKAEKYFESKIVLPSYIPEGFMLTDISIPDETQKCVKLKYSSASADFEILQSKSISKLSGTENISIGNNTAYINSVKDEKSKVITTKIIWTIGNIQYSLSSTLPKDSLINIAKSINN